jgi:hypothetical protein
MLRLLVLALVLALRLLGLPPVCGRPIPAPLLLGLLRLGVLGQAESCHEAADDTPGQQPQQDTARAAVAGHRAR